MSEVGEGWLGILVYMDKLHIQKFTTGAGVMLEGRLKYYLISQVLK